MKRVWMYTQIGLTGLVVLLGLPVFILFMSVLSAFANKNEDFGRFDEYDNTMGYTDDPYFHEKRDLS